MIPASLDTLTRYTKDVQCRGAMRYNGRTMLVFDGGLMLDIGTKPILLHEEEGLAVIAAVESSMSEQAATLSALSNVRGSDAARAHSLFTSATGLDWLAGSTLAEEGVLGERDLQKRQRRADAIFATVPDV